jgi:short-subunit dehydrogenase
MWTPFKEQRAENILSRLNDKKSFNDPMDRYVVTKLLNVFWIVELASRISAEGVVINFVNPGLVNTSLHRNGNKALQTCDRILLEHQMKAEDF